MSANASNTNNVNAHQGTSKQNRTPPNSNNGNAQAPKPQRQGKQQNKQANQRQPNQQNKQQKQQNKQSQTPAGQPKAKREPNNNAKQSKAKKPAFGPNFTESNGKCYKIGPEYNARNFMGWRKNEKTGSSVQFLFKPKMVSRIDQVYYRRQAEGTDRFLHTFGVGVFVQDSTLERNAIFNHADLTDDQKSNYIQNLSDAFNAILLRTRNAFESGTLPALTVDAESS